MSASAALARSFASDDITESRLYATIKQIEELTEDPFFRRHQKSTRHPKFFLGSLTEHWRPLLVLHRKERDLVALVYAKERTALGLGLGTVYVDATLNSTVVTGGVDFENALAASVDALLASANVHALRMVVPESVAGRLTASRPNVSVFSKPACLHSVLELPGDYEGLLSQLGPHSRRNMRYYRRRFESLEGRFVRGISLDEFRRAASHIFSQAGTGSKISKVNRFVSIVSELECPLLFGLQTKNGEWLSVMGAWQERSSATVFFQMNNDRQYAKMSLGLILRGYVLEELINRGIHDVFFWAGVSEPFSRIVSNVRAVNLYFDKPHPLYWMGRHVVKALRPLLPPRLAYHADWLAPADT